MYTWQMKTHNLLPGEIKLEKSGSTILYKGKVWEKQNKQNL